MKSVLLAKFVLIYFNININVLKVHLLLMCKVIASVCLVCYGSVYNTVLYYFFHDDGRKPFLCYYAITIATSTTTTISATSRDIVNSITVASSSTTASILTCNCGCE